MAEHARTRGSQRKTDRGADAASQSFVMSERMLIRLSSYGQEEHFAETTVLPRGLSSSDLFVVLAGRVEVSKNRREGLGLATTVLTRGEFTGELGLLGGREILLNCRVKKGSRVLRISPASLNRMMHAEADIADLIMHAWMSRRDSLVEQGEGGAIIFGIGTSADTMRLQQFLGRNEYPNRTFDAKTNARAATLLDALNVSAEDLPVVFLPDRRLLKNPSNAELASALGLQRVFVDQESFDVAIVGAGPSGLAAAVYAASEGLRAIVIEGNAPGGQAGTSSKIENYLGFPTGVTGQELASRAEVQARRFGARLEVSRRVIGLSRNDSGLSLCLADGERVLCKAVVVATGARYRKLLVEGYESLEFRNIHYAATPIEARHCVGRTVVVIGGGNSAGQAAIHLSMGADHVHVVVRAGSIESTMSDYLVKRLTACERITIHLRAEVSAISGQEQLETVTISDRHSAMTKTLCVSDIFVLIGADPNTDWLQDSLHLDRHGFVVTGNASFSTSQFASSVEGVFAIGDVRAGSVKRVASAVGEGSAVISDVHRYLTSIR